MSDVFISYVQEDSSLAEALAEGLEQQGYSTWYYGKHSLPGVKYLQQTREAIENCRAVLLLISERSLSKARQVDLEVDRTVECGKVFLPVLVDINWPELQKRQPTWGQAIGSTVGITIPPEGIASILPKLAAGLKALGILPRQVESASHISLTYPLPLAAAYAQKMSRPGDYQQAFQAHANLGDMADALIKTLAILTVCFYRQRSTTPGSEDSVVESELLSLQQPRLETWVALLHITLSLYAEAPHPLLGKIYTFFYEKNHRDDALSKAAAALSGWLNLTTPRRPPVSFQDFFELLAAYRAHPGGWAASGAVFSPQEYAQRVEVLHAALEFSLAQLRFLSAYRLVNVQKSISAGDYRIYDATGRTLVSKTEELRSQRPLEAGHTYLCEAEQGTWQTFIDLFPLLILQDCRGCRQARLFLLAQGRENQAEYASPDCGHRLDLSEALSAHPEFSLAAYLHLEQWRSQAVSAAPGSSAPYLTALREVLANGEIDALEREKLDFLAKMLRLPEQTTARLEALVREDLAPAQPEPQPPATQGVVEPVSTPPELAVEQRLVLCWQRSTPGPVPFTLLFGAPPLLLAADLNGNVQVFNQNQELVYEERVEGRPYRLAAAGERAYLTTWKGSLYCFGTQDLLWQHSLGSPLSALAAAAVEPAVVSGAWDGQMHAFDSRGGLLWKTSLEDGISSLALAEDAQLVGAGSYAGHLCVFDLAGEKKWLQDLRSGVVKLAFTHRSPHLIVARRDRLLMRLNAQDQALVWDINLEEPPLDFALSPNDRRLVLAARQGGLNIYTLEGAPNLHSHYSLPQVSGLCLSPLSAEGSLALALTPESVTLADSRARALSVEISQPAIAFSLSADGRSLALGGDDFVSLYRLGKPQLSVLLEPLGKLSKGRFTRLRITLRNSGERLARNIELRLEGPFDCQPTGLPDELRPGESAASDQQSLQPQAPGTLPVYAHLKYSDDFNLQHQHTERLVLESAGGEPAI